MYSYTNIVGNFVFNQNFKIREKILFKNRDIPFLQNDQIDNKLAKKFKNIMDIQENTKFRRKIDEELRSYKTEFYKNNLELTKSQIQQSITLDLLIIQVSNTINELNKTINILIKRLREWYSYVLPEIESIVSDNRQFAEIIQKTRNSLINKYNIKESMGISLDKKDQDAIISLSNIVLSQFEEKDYLETYLEKLMEKSCPNLTAVAGFSIGARLIAYAGSLKKLAFMPASTIQILGAEKALFRHMTTGAKPPRHGIIVNHPLISGKPQKEHGKRARALADKISLAVKIDYFKGKFIGRKLEKELKERFS